MATHKAVYDFEPDEEGEIKLTFGDRVNLVVNFGDGWAEVTNLETGRKGVVPENYIELSSRPSDGSKYRVNCVEIDATRWIPSPPRTCS